MDNETPFSHKRTSATATGITKPEGARNSAFDNGTTKPKRTATRLPRLDIDTLVIKTGEPLPPLQYELSPYKRLLEKLQPGQSVEMSPGHAKSLVSCAKKSGIKLAIRQLDATTAGIWRLS